MDSAFAIFAIASAIWLSAGALAYFHCGHQWERTALWPEQERGLALFAYRNRNRIHVRGFWHSNSTNLECTKCGRADVANGSGFVPPYYFDPEYQQHHAQEVLDALSFKSQCDRS
jgi:hypothetical protein